MFRQGHGLLDIFIISDAHIKNTKYHWQLMATALINIYKCTYVKTGNEMKCTK